MSPRRIGWSKPALGGVQTDPLRLWLLPLAEKAGRSSCSANIWDLERIARVFVFDYVAPY